MDGGRKRVRKIACNNMLNARIRIFAGVVPMRLDSRINAMLMGQIKAYVDARVDEKIAIALSREELRKQLTSAELDVYIENRIKKALCQYRC